MLPNHSPMVIAEQFGTLESLYPGRIDLGLGRAPGSDQLTARALRRNHSAADDFPQDVLELQALLGPVQPGQAVQAVPGGGLEVPLWILGSSTYGAQLAAMLGLPYAFASHFAPDMLTEALDDLPHPLRALGTPGGSRTRWRGSTCSPPRATRRPGACSPRSSAPSPTCCGVPPAPTARPSTTSRPTGRRASATTSRACCATRWWAGPRRCAPASTSFAALTGVEELMVVSAIHDHEARVRSFEILAEVAGQVGVADPVGTGP